MDFISENNPITASIPVYELVVEAIMFEDEGSFNPIIITLIRDE